MESRIRRFTAIVVMLLVVMAIFVDASVSKECLAVGDQFSTLSINSIARVQADAIVPNVTVVINELMADNSASLESPFGTFPDWIELYNTGNQSVDLSGMYLTDNYLNPTWQFSNGTVLEPNGFLLVWADGNSQLGSLHADFRLNANGETIALISADKNTLIDFVQFEKQIQDVSYGRSPDGSSSWKYLTRNSPGKANVENLRAQFSAYWPIWLFAILVLVACVSVLIRDRIRVRSKK